jgi:hypothetical protein
MGGGGGGGRAETKRLKEMDNKFTTDIESMKEEMKEFSEGQLGVMEAVQIMENGSE